MGPSFIMYLSHSQTEETIHEWVQIFIVLPNNQFTNKDTNSQMGPSFILHLIS